MQNQKNLKNESKSWVIIIIAYDKKIFFFII